MAQQYKIAIVGEAPGRQEEIYGRPFVGAAGDELNRLLADAGILQGNTKDIFRERGEKIHLTNVFSMRPPSDDNSILALCCKKKDLPNGGKGYKHPALTQGWYVKPEYLGELDRLKSELESIRPNIVIAVGNTPLWALTGKVGIEKYRGATTESTLVPGLKVLPTYHPASLFRVWNRRPMLVMDLIKARMESETPHINRVSRLMWLEPTLADLMIFWNEHLANASIISFDIENPRDIISCISFAPSPHLALVVPFEDERKPANSYWPSRADEILAWRWCKFVLESSIPKLAQNGMYDMSHLEKAGIFVRNYEHDTMLLHHALQPEERKGLGVLGSMFANESAWKTDGNFKSQKKSIKRDA